MTGVQACALPISDNGDITPSTCESDPRHGDTCLRTCDRGYQPVGPMDIRRENGQWSDTAGFQCRVRECQALGEVDNGQITPPICSTRPLHGQTCVYECSR